MIVRITGQVVDVNESRVHIDRDGICYEVLIPDFAADQLSAKVGQNVTLHTLEYFEGSAMGGNMYHRMVGFTEPVDREFFLEFIKVRGMGFRKALRAFAEPAHRIAYAIEESDTKLLTSLPEIGKRTAEHLIASLRGKLDKFALAAYEGDKGDKAGSLTQMQHEALEILIQLGEKRGEAAEMIQKICKADDSLSDPAQIVNAVYKQKAGKV